MYPEIDCRGHLARWFGGFGARSWPRRAPASHHSPDAPLKSEFASYYLRHTTLADRAFDGAAASADFEALDADAGRFERDHHLALRRLDRNGIGARRACHRRYIFDRLAGKRIERAIERGERIHDHPPARRPLIERP